MGRAWLILAFIASAGTAGAQTMHAPQPGTTGADAQTSTQATGGARANADVGTGPAPEMASAPIPLSAAAEMAREQIERDGYRDVRGLARGADGLWQGTALRGNTSVQVTVDRAGNVAAK